MWLRSSWRTLGGRSGVHPEIAEAIAPVLRDISATCGLELDVRDEQWGYDGKGHSGA